MQPENWKLCAMLRLTQGSRGQIPASRAFQNVRFRYSAMLPCFLRQWCSSASYPARPLWQSSQVTGAAAMAWHGPSTPAGCGAPLSS